LTVPEPGIAQPLVSIVTVCLNAEEHIGQAVESVLAQTYQPIEYVVVDGGSSDATLEIVRGYEPRFEGQMRWVSEPDEGLYDAMNKGVGMARGELVGILNADDYYEPDAVMRAVATWQANPEAGVVYGDLRTIAADGVAHRIDTPSPVTLAMMRRRMTPYHPAMFVTAATYRQLGGYDTRYPLAADYDLVLRWAEEGVTFARIDAVVTNFSLQGESHRRVRATDRDSTRVRISHGVNPVAAWARYGKRAVFSAFYRLLSLLPGFNEAYERRKGSRDAG